MDNSGMASLVAAAAAAAPMRTPAAVSGGPTYHGYIASTQDCLLLFEACRVGVLRRIQRRLSEQEREKAIRSGSVFVWEEGESGIKRWTDSKSWSPSRIKGSFLVYREVDEATARRRASSFDSDDAHPSNSGAGSSDPRKLSIASTTSSVHVPLLTKKSISVRTKEGGKLHVVCYYTKSDVSSGRLQTPRDDPALQTLAIRAGLYPEILPEISLMPSTPSTPDSVLRIRASLQGNGIGAAAANNAAAAAAAAAGGLSIEAPRTPDDMYAVSAARSQEYSHGLVPSFTGRVEDYAFPETTTVHRRLSTDLQASRALVPYCKTRGEGGGGSGRGSVSSNSGGGDQVYPPPPAPIVTNTSTRNQYRNHPYSRQTPAAPAAFTSPRGGGGQQTYQTHQLPTPTSAQYSPLEFADAQYYRHVYSQQQQQAQQLDAASQKHQVAAAQQPDQQTQQLQQQQQQQSSPQQTTQSLHAPTSQAQQQQTQQSQQSAAQRLPPLRMAVSRIEDDSRWGTM